MRMNRSAAVSSATSQIPLATDLSVTSRETASEAEYGRDLSTR